MIGPLEILILVVVVLIVFGAYKRLPALGRSAGKSARVGGEKAKELAGVARQKAEGIDTKNIANQAGKGIREAKELKQAITDPVPDKKSDNSGGSEEPPAGKPSSGASSAQEGT